MIEQEGISSFFESLLEPGATLELCLQYRHHALPLVVIACIVPVFLAASRVFLLKRLFTAEVCEVVGTVPERECLECSLCIPKILCLAFGFELEASRTGIVTIRQETGTTELIPRFLDTREAKRDNVCIPWWVCVRSRISKFEHTQFWVRQTRKHSYGTWLFDIINHLSDFTLFPLRAQKDGHNATHKQDEEEWNSQNQQNQRCVHKWLCFIH
mmetsp:Transcript_29182/g.57146  ORF Transcript_29182/g.57146 Transcript_29182/m.57146 type:complete len:213 (-) Transcript_29182:441-1079(-)